MTCGVSAGPEAQLKELRELAGAAALVPCHPSAIYTKPHNVCNVAWWSDQDDHCSKRVDIECLVTPATSHMHADIYCERGLSPHLAKQVAVELSEKDVIRAHARDELVSHLT